MASTDSINTNNNSNKKMSIRSPLPPHVNALLKSSEETPHRLLRSSCKPQSSKKGSSKLPVASSPVSSLSTGSTSSVAGTRRVGRPPQKQGSHVGAQGEDEKYLTVEPKKTVGAKLPQKGRAVTMSVITEPYSEAVKPSSLAEAVNSSLVISPEHSPSLAVRSTSCSMIHTDHTPHMGVSTSGSVLSPPIVSSPTKKSPHRRSSSGSRTPRKKRKKKHSEEFEQSGKLVEEEEAAPTFDIFQTTGRVPLANVHQTDVPTSSASLSAPTLDVFQTTGRVPHANVHQTDVSTSSVSLPVGDLLEGEVSMAEEQKVIAQEDTGEKQLGEAMESSANDTQSEDGEREEEEGDSNSEEFKEGHLKRIVRKRSKRKSSADGYPKAKRGRRPGRGRGSRSARSSSSSRQSAESTPGARLKVCNNCGTVSEKTKAKKCHKCKKFFYDHWAKRCKIPPCPKCHFSRKSRHLERIPSNCNRCGYPLPSSDVHVAAVEDPFVLEREEEEGEGEGEGEEEVMEYESPSVAKNVTNVSNTYSTTEVPPTMTNLETRLKCATEFSLEIEPQASDDEGHVLEKSMNTGVAMPTSEGVSPSIYGVQKEEPLVKTGPSTTGSPRKEGHDDQISAAISAGATPQTTGTSSADHEQTGASSLSHNTGTVAITRSGKVYKQGAVKETTLKALKEKIMSTQQREPNTLVDACPPSTSVEHSTVNLSESPAKFFSNVPILGTMFPQVTFPASSHHLVQHTSSSPLQTMYAPVYTPINTFTMQANNGSSSETTLQSKEKDNKPDQKIETKQTFQLSSSQVFGTELGVKCQTAAVDVSPGSIKGTTPVVSSVNSQVSATFTQSQSDSSTQTASGLPQSISLVDTDQTASRRRDTQTTFGLVNTSWTAPSLSQTTSLVETNKSVSSFPRASSLVVINQTAPSLPRTTSLAYNGHAVPSLFQTGLVGTNQTVSSFPRASSLVVINQAASSLPQTTTCLAYNGQMVFSFPKATNSLAYTTQTASSLPQTTTSLVDTNRTASSLPRTTSSLVDTNRTASNLPQTTTNLVDTNRTAPNLSRTTTSLVDTNRTAPNLSRTTTSLVDTNRTTPNLPQTTTNLVVTNRTAPNLSRTTTSLVDTNRTTPNLPETTTSLVDTDQMVSSLSHTTTSLVGTDQMVSSLPQTTTSLASTYQTASNLPQTTTSLANTDQTTASSLPQTTTSLANTDQTTASSLPQTTTSLANTDQTTASSLPQTTTSLANTDQTTASSLPQTTTSLANTDQTTASSLPQTTTSLANTDQTTASSLPQTTTNLANTDSMKAIPFGKSASVSTLSTPAAPLKREDEGMAGGEQTAALMDEDAVSTEIKVEKAAKTVSSLFFSEKFRNKYGHFQSVKAKPKSKRKNNNVTPQQPPAPKKKRLSDDEPEPEAVPATTSLNPNSPTGNVPQLLRYAQELGINFHLNLPVLPSDVKRPLTHIVGTTVPPSLVTTASLPMQQQQALTTSKSATVTTASLTSVALSSGPSVATQTTGSVNKGTTKHLPPLAPIAVSAAKQTSVLPSPQLSPPAAVFLPPTLSVYTPLLRPILLQPPPPLKPSDSTPSTSLPLSSLSTLMTPMSSHSPSIVSCTPTSAPLSTSAHVSATESKKLLPPASTTEGVPKCIMNPNSINSSQHSSSQHSSSQHSSSQHSSSQHSSSQHSSSQHSSSQHSSSQHSSSQHSSSQHSSSQHSLTRPSVAPAQLSISQGTDSINTSEVGSKCPPGPVPVMSSGKTVVTARTFIPAPSTIAGSNVKVSVIATQFSPHPPLTAVTNPSLIQVLQTQVGSTGAPKSSVELSGGTVAMASEPSAPKVVYTQTIKSSKVSAIVQKGTTDASKALPCIAKPDPVPKVVSTASRKVDSTQQASGSLIDASLQIIASNVQSRIKEVLQKTSAHESSGNTNAARTQNVSNPSGPNLKMGIGSVQVTAMKPSDHHYNGGIPAKVLVSPVPAISKQVQPPLLKPAPVQPPSLRPAPVVERKQPSLLPKAPGPVVTVRLLDAKETQNWSHKTNTSTVAEKLQRCTQPNQPQATINLPTSVMNTFTTVPVPALSEKDQPIYSSSSDTVTGRPPNQNLAGPTAPKKGSEKTQARRFLTFDAAEAGNRKEVAMEIDSACKGVASGGGEEGEESQLSQESDRESEGYFKLVSEETLASESDHTSEGGNNKTDNRQKESSGAGGRDGGEEKDEGQNGGGGGGGGSKQEEGRGGVGGGEQWEGAGGSGSKRKKKSGSGGSHKKMTLYSVKLKDCFFHHVIWGDSRMVLMVPLGGSPQGATNKNPTAQEQKPTKTTPTRPSASLLQKHPASNGGNVQREGGEGGGSGERRRRRKAKLEPLVQEVEEDLGTLEESPSGGIPIPVHTPCFSVYELRHKLFSSFSSSAVYVYTYKNQIKSFRPPIHWVYVLKRMGGMQESCHTCRILQVGNVKGMCENYDLTMPPSVECLCRNELPNGRKVIDLSNVDPEDLDGNDLERIPFCSFFEKVSKKKKKSRKRSRKSDEVALEQQQHEQKEEKKEEKEEKKEEEEQEDEKKEEEEQEEEDKGEGNGGEGDEAPVLSQRTVHADKVGGSARVRSPPPLIKHSSTPPPLSRKPGKKKPCPHCGTPVLRKCKKCPVCSKTFGVFTFGRRQCVYCGRVNLARMPACVDCGESLHGAPIAMPKPDDSTEKESPALVRKLDFMFGVRKRRRVRSVPLPFPSNEGPQKSSQHQTTCHPSTAETEFSAECSDVFQGEGEEDGDESRAATPAEASVQKSVKSKQAGYQYGRIPWADADITVLVDERGVPKFCLQELCIKVLTDHVKSEVFEVVKDLNLPMESGDITLLKKLQALGLHSNRSPMCRLIAAEDLWALLDALQEPVPEEVHQHLENINASTSPLMSPGLPSNGIQSPAVVPVAGGPGVGGMLDEDEHGFESTLHEVECSDGQYISILRAWNGEEYACLPEVWRKYFPEVNRNHLTSVLKRLELETHMPTGQQATLLRSAGVISLRGAPGRLMKLEDLQMLLDDFSIPLQIGTSSPSDSNSAPPKQSQPPALRPQVLSTSMPVSGASTPHNKTLATVEDLQFAECMRNLLVAVEEEDLRKLLERSHDVAMDTATMADQDTVGVLTELDAIQQLMQARRDLCNILSKEIGFLTGTTHGYMAEIIRLSHIERQSLQEVDHLLNSMNVSLL